MLIINGTTLSERATQTKKRCRQATEGDFVEDGYIFFRLPLLPICPWILETYFSFSINFQSALNIGSYIYALLTQSTKGIDVKHFSWQWHVQ